MAPFVRLSCLLLAVFIILAAGPVRSELPAPEAKRVLVDCYGDPLSEHALARLVPAPTR